MMHLQNNSPKQALRARQTETDRRRFSSIRRVGVLKRLGADYNTLRLVESAGRREEAEILKAIFPQPTNLDPTVICSSATPR